MRTGAVAFLLLMAIAASARAGSGPTDAERTALKVAQTDLRAALDWEDDALSLAEHFRSNEAHGAIRHALGALDEMGGAARELTPPGFWVMDWRAAHGGVEAWSRFAAELRSAVTLDRDALKEFSGDIIAKVEDANKIKRNMLDLVTNTLRDPCTEVIDVRGPITVNGVPQGHSQLTVSVSCQKRIKEIDLGVPGSVWTSSDAGRDPTKTAAGGAVLEVDVHGAKSASVTATANPDVRVGEVLAGDIIPIAGDSHPPIDEVM